MSKFNTSCSEQQSYQFDNIHDGDIENNHTDESIEYYKNNKNNIIIWSRKFINFFTTALFLRNPSNNDQNNMYKVYP